MWHITTQEETRKAFENYNQSEIVKLKYVCMKKFDGKFGYISNTNLNNKQYIIEDMDNIETYMYKSIDDLIKDGWVID